MADNLSSLSEGFREALLRRNLSIGDIRIPNTGLTRELGEYSNSSTDTENSLYISNLNSVTSSLEYNRYASGDIVIIQDNSRPIVRYNGSETYLDKYDIGSEETGKIKAINMVGSVLNGTGIGWNGSGFEDTFDIRTTLAGRVLSATGIIKDTPLGMIANRELLNAFTNRVMFNAQRETLGRVNIDPVNAIKGGDLIRPDYSITIGHDGPTKAMEVLEDLTGINLPFTQLSPDATIENPMGLIKNTGKGQVNQLFLNLSSNTYAPNYEDSRVSRFSLSNKKTYAQQLIQIEDAFTPFSELYISNIKLNTFTPDYKEEGTRNDYGEHIISRVEDENYVSDEFKANIENNSYKPDYKGEGNRDDYGESVANFGELKKGTDDYGDIAPHSDSLLSKTKELLSKNSRLSLASNKGIEVKEQYSLNTTSIGGTQFLSKGSGVLNKEALRGVPDTNGNVFGRVFTKDDPYKYVKNLQKKRGLAYTDSAADSVLDSNGFIRVGPNKNDIMEGREANIKNFMFSIENLAWHDSDNMRDLAPSEIGPGDLITGTKGRIMWFPPYDISFNEVTTVNWESTAFIGRGEPIYTYNNTERVGSLDFKVIMDYPGYMEDLKGKTSDELFRAIAAGVEDIDYASLRNLAVNERAQIETNSVVKTETKVDNPQIAPEEFELYYNNGISQFDFIYEADGLNAFYTNEFIQNLKDNLEENCPACEVIITGYCSFDEREEDGYERAGNLRRDLIDAGFTKNIIKTHPDNVPFIGCSGEEFPEDSECKKLSRKVRVEFIYVPEANEENNSGEVEQTNSGNLDLSMAAKKRFLNEALFFEKLSEENPLVYESLSESIKYFHPAFHSITPEGFSSRLNFLQQCTRQGPTQGEYIADNLSFGKPPVCILRLGDFYHTKIVIDSVNLSFEDHQWDLNPEGAGVQPMIAKVSLSFRFIGGSSLKGPINKLQNAVAFNFFANTEIYDDRALYIVKGDNGKYRYSDDRPDYNFDVNEEPTGVITAEPKSDGVLMPPQATSPSNEDLFKNLIYTYAFKTFNVPEGETEELSFTFDKREPIVITEPMKIKIKVTYNLTGEEFNLDPIDLSDDMANGVVKTWRTFPKRLNIPYNDWPSSKGPLLLLKFSYKGLNKIIEFPTMDYGV